MTTWEWLRRIGRRARVTAGVVLAGSLLSLAAFTVMAIPSSPAHAASLGTCTWNGSVSNDLSVGGNWTSGNGASCGTGSATDTATLSNYELIFPAAVPAGGSVLTSVYDESADDIVFDNSYTLTGSHTLSLSGANYATTPHVLIDAESGSSTIGTNISFGSNWVDLEAGSGAEVDVTGDVSANNSSLYVGYEGGSGTVALSGSDTSLTDGIMVYDGTLDVGSDGALGTGGIDVLSDMDVSQGGSPVLAVEGGVTVSNDTLWGITGTLEATGSGTATWGGSADLYLGYNGNETVTVAAATGSTLDVTATMDDQGRNTSLVVGKSGGWAGTVEMSGSGNSWTGPTTVAYGTVEDGADSGVSPNAALDVEAGATLEMNGYNQSIMSTTGSGTGTISDSGAPATLSLGGLNSSYTVDEALTGAESVEAMMNPGVTITLSGVNSYSGATTVLSGGDGTLAITTSSALGNTSGVTVGNTSQGWQGTLELDGNITVPSTVPLTLQRGVLDLSGAAGTSGAWDGTVAFAGSQPTATLAAAPGDTLKVNGVVSGSPNQLTAGASGMTGTVDLTAANTYSASTTDVADGTLEVGNDDALGTGTGTVGRNSIIVDKVATLSLDSGISISAGPDIADLQGVLEAGSGTATWGQSVWLDTGGTLAAAPGANLNVTGQVGGGALTSGTSSLTGTVDLSGGSNDFTGATTAAYGTLQDGTKNAVPTTTTLDVNSGATFDLNGNDQTVGSLGSSAGSITNTGSAGVTITDEESGTSAVTATLTNGTNPLSLTMAGSGTLELAGSDSYTGATIVAGASGAGTLEVANDSALGSSATHTSGVTVAAGTTLDLTGGVSVPSAIPITDLAGVLETTDTSGADTWAGPVALDGSSGGSLAAGTGATLEVSGVVSGGGLTAGASGMAGIVDLQAANTYTGGTTVEDGTLETAKSSALGASPGSVAVDSGAVLALDNGVSVPSGMDISDLQGVLEADGGTATWAGAVGIDAGGTLAAASGATLDVSGAVDDYASNPGATLTFGTAGLTGTVDLSGGSNDFTGATTAAYGILQDGTKNAVPTTTTLDVNSGATFDLNGNDQTVGSLGSGTGGITDSATAADFTVGNLGADDTVGETLSGSMSLIVDGNGHTLTLSGTNTYTGATTVASGTLDVTGSLASGVTVSSGATLQGTGTVGGATAGGGVIEPGDASTNEGTLTTSSGADLSAAGSALTVVIGGKSAGTYGQLAVNSGALNVTGATLNVSFSGFTSAASDTYDIVTNSSGSPVTGTFAGLPQYGTMTVGGRRLMISYDGGASGHDIVLTDVTYSGSGHSGGGSGSTSTTVSVQVSPTSAVQGESVTYSATVAAASGSSGTPTGTVAFATGSTSLCTANLSGSGGTASGSCTATNAPVGTDTVTGTYSGDSSFAAYSGQATLTVTAPVPAPSFSDVPQGYWAYQAIEGLVAKGIVAGFPGGTFRPGASVTRAQFVKMLVLTLGLKPVSGSTLFIDVPQGSWFAPYVAAAVQAGIVQGLTPTSFGPSATITREQMAVLIARALKLDKTQSLQFTDVGQIGAWALQGVEEAVAAGYLSGFPNGTFQPLGTTTRAQAAKVLFLVLQNTSP